MKSFIIVLASMLPAVGVVRAAIMPPGIVNQLVLCYSTLRCDPSDPGMTYRTTTLQCCLSEGGLAYSPSGSECNECICK